MQQQAGCGESCAVPEPHCTAPVRGAKLPNCHQRRDLVERSVQRLSAGNTCWAWPLLRRAVNCELVTAGHGQCPPSLGGARRRWLRLQGTKVERRKSALGSVCQTGAEVGIARREPRSTPMQKHADSHLAGKPTRRQPSRHCLSSGAVGAGTTVHTATV